MKKSWTTPMQALGLEDPDPLQEHRNLRDWIRPYLEGEWEPIEIGPYDYEVWDYGNKLYPLVCLRSNLGLLLSFEHTSYDVMRVRALLPAEIDFDGHHIAVPRWEYDDRDWNVLDMELAHGKEYILRDPGYFADLIMEKLIRRYRREFFADKEV